MALFGNKNTASLGAALATKGSELRAKQENDAKSSEALAVAAAEAQRASVRAAKHAAAVEQALKILGDAGVEL